MAYRVAVVGATGAVGREIIKTLAERNFPVSEVIALASGRSTGAEISFGDKKILKVRNLDTFDFTGTDIAMFSPGASISAVHAPRAAAQGCVVIDNTSHFRMDPDVPLVVPEVNPEALRHFARRNIIANPNCSTIQMVVALKPLHDEFKIKRVVVATYQSVSGAGKEGMDELFNHTKSSFVYEQSPPQQFTKEIAFNCIPHIDMFMDDGSTKEEWKMTVETKKILDPSIAVHATCVRVPVFIGHGEAVNVEFERPVTAGEARAALRDAPGVDVVDVREDGGYVTPLESAGEDAVFVSRLRKDPTVEHGLSFWCVSDNLRKGAALNSVQIAETMIAMNLLTRESGIDCSLPDDWMAPSAQGSLDDAPCVAILLSTFNGERFLPEQLASIAGQTYTNWRLYWRDDGSSDGTPGVMAAFFAAAARGRSVAGPTGERMRATRSFLALLRAALGGPTAFFAFADQDDVWLPDKLAHGMAALRGLPVDRPALYFCGRALVDARLVPVGQILAPRRSPGFPAALTQNVAPGCCMLLNRAAAGLIDASPLPDGAWHDWWSYVVVAAHGGAVVAGDSADILYRQHNDNLVGEPRGFWHRTISAARRGRRPFMALFWAQVAALQAGPALPCTTRSVLEAIESGRRGGFLRRLRILRLPGLMRQTAAETALFRLWFLLG